MAIKQPLGEVQVRELVCFTGLGLCCRIPFSLCQPLPFVTFSYRPQSILLQLFQCPKKKCSQLRANFKCTFISLLFFLVRCLIITNSNKGLGGCYFFFFYYLRYSVAFVFLASAVTSEDCIQGAKCAGPRVRAAEYTNLRKHRQ